jgi:hypothetical protein
VQNFLIGCSILKDYAPWIWTVALLRPWHCEIGGSQIYVFVLGCNAVWTSSYLLLSSTLKMETVIWNTGIYLEVLTALEPKHQHESALLFDSRILIAKSARKCRTASHVIWMYRKSVTTRCKRLAGVEGFNRPIYKTRITYEHDEGMSEPNCQTHEAHAETPRTLRNGATQ